MNFDIHSHQHDRSQRKELVREFVKKIAAARWQKSLNVGFKKTTCSQSLYADTANCKFDS